ncbi:MAG: thiamine phosphate synthase [Muribaculaceae bacterium]|nr:thiamine phosphate synthase [Muribaculaceae bacterium]
MIQFITQAENRYSLAEQIQMAIEAGCGWVIVDPLDNSDEDIKSSAEQFIPMCRETGVILTMINRPLLAKELGVHGVWMTEDHPGPRQVREDLGPEAIIGKSVKDVSAISALKAMDIDYCSLDMSMGLENIDSIVGKCREMEIEMPLVVTGDIGIENLQAVMATGANGVATGKHILSADNPVEYFRSMLEILNKGQ